MMSIINKSRQQSTFRLLQKWHRYIGLSIVLLIIPIAITGFILNHQSEKNHVKVGWLLDWYNINTPTVTTQYTLGNQHVSQWDQDVYINQKHIGSTGQLLTGFVASGDFYILAFTSELWLMTNKGELVEKVRPLKSHTDLIKKLGLFKTGIYIHTGVDTYVSDDLLASWRRLERNNRPANTISWSKADIRATEYQHDIANRQRHRILSWQRVIQDLHSGRFFGTAGVIIVDIVGVLLIMLALSGLVMWLKRLKLV